MHFSIHVNEFGVNVLIDGSQEEIAKLDAERVTTTVRSLDFVPDDAHLFLSISSVQRQEYDFPIKTA